MFQTLQNLPYSIIALQEIHGNKDATKIWEKEWPGKSIWCPTTCSHSCGVAFLFNKRFNASILHHKCDADGRALGVHVKIQNSNFQILNIYAPTKVSKRPYFLSNILKYSYSNLPLILLGDFNMVEDPSIDRAYSNDPQTIIGLKQLNKIKGQ